MPAGSGYITLAGNTTTPANCIISATGNCFYGLNVSRWIIKGFKLTSSGAALVQIEGGGSDVQLGETDFGTSGGPAHIASRYNATITMIADYLISGQTTYAHYSCYGAGLIVAYNRTVTILANVTFSFFANSEMTGVLNTGSLTYSLGAFVVTGARYRAVLNAVVRTGGGGASYFPGSSAGTTGTGGQYN
jgi:hypothetical protein